MAKQKFEKEKKNQPASPTSQEPIAKTQAASSAPNRQRTILLVAAIAGLALCLTIYLLRLDRVFGLIVDDAWYVLLAKALATGQGYTLINSPSPGITPFYSPGFPALLAIFYRLWPDFPNNILLLKSVSIVAMMGVGVVAFCYYKRDRGLPVWPSYALALAVVLFPATVFLATSSVMSECVFTLTQLGVIVLIERCVREGKADPGRLAWRFAALGGLLAAFAFLTRPAGIGLLVAAVLYLFKEKLTKQALIFAAIVAVLVGPWMLYSRSHAPTPEQRAEQGANIVQPYTTQLWQKVAGQPLAGTIDASDLPERIGTNLSEIAKYDFGGIAFFPFFRPLEPGEPVRIPSEGRALSIAMMLLALAGYVGALRERVMLAELVVPMSIGVTTLWGWEQFRLLIPLVPFLLLYLLLGVRLLARLYQKLQTEPNPRGETIPLLIVASLLVIINVYGNVQYIQKKYDPVPEYRLRWISAFDENLDLIKYIENNIPKQDVLATQNPALLHLFTGHKTVASDDPAGSWETWNRIGVRHLARTSPLPLPKPDAAESKYRTVYRPSGRLNLRLVDLGYPASRPAWGK